MEFSSKPYSSRAGIADAQAAIMTCRPPTPPRAAIAVPLLYQAGTTRSFGKEMVARSPSPAFEARLNSALLA